MKKKRWIFIIVSVLCLALAAACSNGKGLSKDKPEQKDVDSGITFHDITFEVPEGYELVHARTDADNLFYEIKADGADADEAARRTIEVKYYEGVEGNILTKANARAFSDKVASEYTGYEPAGYSVVAIDEELSGIRINLKKGKKGKTLQSPYAVAFNDAEGHAYCFLYTTKDDVYDELNTVLRTVKHSFAPMEMEYDLTLEIKYKSNPFFDKYDVEIYVDDDKIGAAAQGDTFKASVPLKEGKHDVTFYKSGDHGVSAATEVDMTQGKTFSCSIKAHSQEIAIKDQKEKQNANGA